MSETTPSTPLDLSIFDNLDPPPAQPQALATQAAPGQPALADPRLAPQPPLERLVEIANLSPPDLAAAQASAAKIDFRQTNTLMAHGDGVLAGIAQASRQLLTGVRLGEAGEVGRIAAAVIDGVKILRISDLQAESNGQPAPRKGIFGKLLGAAADAHTAFKGFAENRKQFLDLMDAEQAKARKTKADLAVTIDLLDQQAVAIRQSLHALKIEIAAGQIAIDRGQDELEALRLHAVETGDPADAADVMEFRGAIANFRGKVAEMREALVGSAMLIPIIGQNKQAAETRMMKISNGMLVVIPRLMAVASQAVVQVDIRNAAGEAEKLDEANRQITLLASKGAREAATSAARSLGGDQRNIDVLAQVADEAIATMNEVIDIEREVAAGDRAREAKLAEVRNRLVKGMQGVNRPRRRTETRAMSQNVDFDTQAAWLRRFRADAESNLRAFALRLKEAMPDLVTIHESKGLFSRTGRTTGVTVELGENKYRLEIAEGRLKASVAMVVRGIALSTKSIDPAEWFARLSEETKKASDHARSLSQSIADFMAS